MEELEIMIRLLNPSPNRWELLFQEQKMMSESKGKANSMRRGLWGKGKCAELICF